MGYLVAVTTSDGEHVDLHFGHADRFLIIEVDPETGEWERKGFRILENTRLSKRAEGAGDKHRHDIARFEAAASLISDAEYLLTERIGPRPERILLHEGVSALETEGSLNKALGFLNAYRRRYNPRR